MAVAYGDRGVAVLLTGHLDDGTAGMVAVKRCGGLCVVQDPDDAAYPDMPANAMRQVDVDHCVPISQMGGLLARLVREPVGPRVPVPSDIAIEARMLYRFPTRMMSPVGAGTPPDGSTDTAIPVGCGKATDVSNTAVTRPSASGSIKPALTGAPSVRTHTW